MTDVFETAVRITVAHADLLAKDDHPSVETVLVRAGCCPSCGAPLLSGGSLGYCVDCKREVTL